MKSCFDAEKYLKLQKAKIIQRIRLFDKLYIEFGGKLIDDYHASRVLPGFPPDLKIRLLQELKEDLEIILCINANDIEKSKIRSDRIITYETEIIRLIEFLRSKNITIDNIVVTLFDGQQKVKNFVNRLADYKVNVYLHSFTKGYPTDIDTIVSAQGYGANPYIPTTKPLVIISAPGANSGKLATSLSQLYHESQKGIKAGYAKFETFPVWDLPLDHPLNLAYEASTADLGDKNMIDHFHLEKYGITAVNYNRDLATFPILKSILHRIIGKDLYFSPTDMGVNVISECITDQSLVQRASKDEIIRRYLKSLVDAKKGLVSDQVPERIKSLMEKLHISESDRPAVAQAKAKQALSHLPSASIIVENQSIVGRKTAHLTPISSTFLNALKTLTNIPDDVDLISSSIIDPIIDIKNQTANFKDGRLELGEVLIALSICSATNPTAKKALHNLHRLSNAQLHSTHIIPDSEMIILNNLNINATCGTEIDLT